MAKQLRGDINNDGKINIIDAVISLKAVSDGTETLLSEDEIMRADINCDGEISLVDVRTILKHISGTELIDEVIE